MLLMCPSVGPRPAWEEGVRVNVVNLGMPEAGEGVRVNVVNVPVYGPWAGLSAIPVSLSGTLSYVSDSHINVKKESLPGAIP